MYEGAEAELQRILRLVEQCPEPLRPKAFEILLQGFVSGLTEHTPPPGKQGREGSPHREAPPPSDVPATALDDCTRYRILRLYRRCNEAASLNFFRELRRGLPFPIRKLQTDNGSEFSITFSLTVQEAGIKHRYIKPRRPQQNGKVERSHRVDNEEFWNRRQFVSHEEAAIALSDWQHAYNHQRFSMALGGQTPVERLAAKLTDPAGPTSAAA
jgi:transposase InsO family protein